MLSCRISGASLFMIIIFLKRGSSLIIFFSLFDFLFPTVAAEPVITTMRIEVGSAWRGVLEDFLSESFLFQAFYAGSTRFLSLSLSRWLDVYALIYCNLWVKRTEKAMMSQRICSPPVPKNNNQRTTQPTWKISRMLPSFFLVWFGSNYTRVVEESARTSVAPPLFYIRVRSNVSWPILSLSLFLSYLLIFLLSKRRKTLTRNCFSHRWKTRRKKKSRTRENKIYIK